MPRIVCIDPDAGRAEEPVKVLRSAGYEVMMACSPEVGLALVHLFPPDVVLLHSDLAEQLEPKIHLACPAVPVVVTGDKPVSVDNLRWLTAHRPDATAEDPRHLSH
ncbi:MAG: hypothetical protein WA188_07505 [Terriglobales bacterium]